MRVFALLLRLAVALPVAAQAPTIDQSLEMKSAGGPRISPDGKWVAYEITHTNWDANAFERELWLASADGAQRVQLTSGKGSSFNAKWSPDGKWIAFMSTRPVTLPGGKLEDSTQIYLIAPSGGEARELTRIETGVSDLEWSPDGHTIAFVSRDAKPKARKDRDSTYGDVQIIGSDYQMSHLWVIDVASGETHRLTEGDNFTVGSFAWSPDGTKIAFSAQRDPDLGSSNTATIYTVTVADKNVKKIVETPGPNTNPVWSPDGSEIAFNTANGSQYFYYTNSVIAIVSANGGAPRAITTSFDENASPIAWTADGIYFSPLQRTYQTLDRVNPTSGAVETLSNAKHIDGGFSIARHASTVAFVTAGDNEYPEIAVSEIKPFAPKTLTTMGEQLAKFKTAHRQLVQWKSSDGGGTIEGVMITPPGFDSTKKYPLLVVIHGGPTGVDRTSLGADRYYPIELFASKGAVILRPNYRGSAGYGEKFRALNVRDLGTGDYADVISGVDYLIGRGFIDRSRVGSMGWSEGGYISAFITTFSDRFKAVSVGAGISDWMTYYVNTDIHPFTRQYLRATPWDDPEIYKKTSPITYIKTAKTPTLIQHGGSDKRVPIPNGFELYQALRDKGVPVRMVVYPGFGHPIDKPKQQRSVMQENLDWFSHYIWGDQTASTAGQP
ncbi:MAG TPA: S9 family peptidase [Gemmatimonadaceae bacterium]|nr:S9 family peptidase [Gemmatimonadaceae bacterium]